MNVVLKEGPSKFKTLANLDEFELRGNLRTDSSQYMQLKVMLCNNSTSPVPCAPMTYDTEDVPSIKSFLSPLTLNIAVLRRFIDYENVEPGVGPI